MALAASLLLVTTLSIPSTTLVLKSGHQIEIEGPIQQEATRVVFREAGGSLYSILLSEIDMDATRAAAIDTRPQTDDSVEAITIRPEPERRIRLSDAERDRLLRELEKNHSGRPPQPQRLLVNPPPPPSRAEVEMREEDEWSWRRQARAYEESVRRAREDHELLLARIEELRWQIKGFFSLGYKPRQFTYQTTQLQYALDSVPQAELEIVRAQRSYDLFREEARRRGVLPGWLR